MVLLLTEADVRSLLTMEMALEAQVIELAKTRNMRQNILLFD